MMSQLNPIARISLNSKLRNTITNKLRQIDSLMENLRCNIYISELVANEIAVHSNVLSIIEQQSIAFDILNGIFSFNVSEISNIKSQFEFLHSHNLVIPTMVDEPKQPKFQLFRSTSSKKKL